MNRPAIPAEIKRAVLVEAGHRCAIPRCGQTELDFHHIVPWETCKKHEYLNLIALCPICHRRAHNGEIDRKSLFLYKESLSINFLRNDIDSFTAPIIEARRRIFEECNSIPGYTFSFDFPDFQEPIERIVSRNIEAWGYELLVKYRENQENYAPFESEDDEPSLFTARALLEGNYSVVRRDKQVISVRYELYRYYTGASHGGLTTRVQNFLVKPFQPITLSDLIGGESNLELFACMIRTRLSEIQKYDREWLSQGTSPTLENFSRFNLDDYGVMFTFSEYQVASYSQGEQTLRISYDELSDFCEKELLEKIRKRIS